VTCGHVDRRPRLLGRRRSLRAAGHVATAQGTYVGYNDAAITGTLPARNATNPYIAYICVQIRDTDEDATGSEDATIAVIQGTPAASPAAPAVPSSLGSLLILSEVLVPSSANGGPVVFTERRMYLNGDRWHQRVTSATAPDRRRRCGRVCRSTRSLGLSLLFG
jgi:hypothetical protein